MNPTSNSDQAKRIIVAVTGGIAAYKAAAMISKLAQSGHDVCATMSPTAESFIGEATLTALTGKPVVKNMFDPRFPLGAHIELARRYDLLCVAPATAHFLAAAAQGHSNDLISTLYLCFTGTVIVAPAMNVEMWNHPAVSRNVQRLRDDGVTFVEPTAGWLSCRTLGTGRMAEPETIIEALTAAV